MELFAFCPQSPSKPCCTRSTNSNSILCLKVHKKMCHHTLFSPAATTTPVALSTVCGVCFGSRSDLRWRCAYLHLVDVLRLKYLNGVGLGYRRCYRSREWLTRRRVFSVLLGGVVWRESSNRAARDVFVNGCRVQPECRLFKYCPLIHLKFVLNRCLSLPGHGD